MPIVRVDGFTISADGFGAGPEQSLHHPLGIGGASLHEWLRRTRTFQRTVLGRDGGESGPDDDIAGRAMANLGAWILGRNMFGPVRGPWPEEPWNGWWGESPPYHVPVFVLTHHARPALEMKGGTSFHFVTEGIQHALDLARKAAGDKDIRIGGGVQTIRQYLQAGVIDQIHLAVSPVFLGKGESLLHGIDLPGMGFRVVEHTPTPNALHVVLRRDPLRKI